MLKEQNQTPTGVAVRQLDNPALDQIRHILPQITNNQNENKVDLNYPNPLTNERDGEKEIIDDSMHKADEGSDVETPKTSRTPKSKLNQRIYKIYHIMKNNFDKFNINKDGKILNERGTKEILGSNVQKSLDCIIRSDFTGKERWSELSPPGTSILEKRLRTDPSMWELIEKAKEQIIPKRINKSKRNLNQNIKSVNKKHSEISPAIEGGWRLPTGYNYALVAIDVLSKRVFAEPVRTKKSTDMIPAFEIILKRMEMHPHRIFSDKGTEFKSKEIMEFFKGKDIEKFTPNASTVKASLAERCIRNIKQRLYRFMSEKHTLKWTEALQKIVNAINHSRSRAICGLRPVDISFKNARKIREKVYGKIGANPNTKKPRFQKDDYVRMSTNKNVFAKGYLPNYSDEILQVDLVKKKANPNRYKVKDDKGERFEGYFYPEELTRVKKDENTSYRIEKVIRKRTNKDGKKEYLVKFFDYPQPEWIDETNFV
uniref:Integrase catalytic domain-containing protein n=1 Tax=Meloidogyne hapla TaxID=6305 RepID=A0A1I8B053_MELHA